MAASVSAYGEITQISTGTILSSSMYCSVAEPPLFWAAPVPDGRGPGADSGSDLLGSAPAPGKKRRLQAAPAPYTKIFQFKLSKS